jgi:invasion protein IalB
MTNLSWLLAVFLLSSAPALADNSTKPASPAKKPTPDPTASSTPTPTLTPVSSDPESTTAIFGDWTLHCVRAQTATKQIKLCEVVQSILVQGQTNPIAQIAFGRVNPDDPLKITAQLPQNLSFPSVVKVSVGEKNPQGADLAWRRCLPGGCFADADVRDDQLSGWRAQNDKGHLEFTDAAGRDIVLPFSFRGLAQALDALAKS